MRDKKKGSMNRVAFFRSLLILVICITLPCVNVFGTPSSVVSAEEIESVDETLLQTEESEEGSEEGSKEGSSEEEFKAGEEGAKEESENYQSARISRAGTPTEVGTWAAFQAALANEDVDHILLTTNLTRPGTAATNNPGTINRNLIIDGGTAGYSINFGSGGTSLNGVILGTVSAVTNLTLTNVTFTKSVTNAAAFSSSTGGSNWNIVINNVSTSASSAAGLIGASNASVTVYGTGNAFTVSNTDLFTAGSFTMDNGAVLTAVSTNTSGSTSNYLFDVSGNFIMRAGSQLTATSVRASIFNVGGTFTMEDGATKLVAASTSTSQSNYQFNVTGNFVMGNGTEFTTSTASTSTSDTYYQVAVGGSFTVGDNAVLVAQSASKSLFGSTGDFIVGEHAAVTANSTSNANRQFSVRNFTAKANSSITTTSNGSTYQFYISGDFTMGTGGTDGTGASLTANSTGASNAILYMGGDGTIDLGSYTTTKLTNSGTATGADGTNSPDLSHGIYGDIGELKMQPHSLLDVDVTNTGYRAKGNTRLTMVDGAVFNVSSTANSAVALCENYSSNYSYQIIANLSGEGTQLNLECASTRTAELGAAMRVAGTDCSFTVTDGAQINCHSKFGTGLQFQGPGTVFDVKNGAKIEIIQDGDNNYSLGAAVRFRLSGFQTFNIDNAQVIITKLSGNTSAVRLYGGANVINVTNGGLFRVYNAGDGTPRNGTSDSQNQGIHYTAAGSRPDSFTLEGYKSAVEIVADFGPAIYSAGSTEVSVSNRAIFLLSGRTSSADNGTLGCGGTFDVTLDTPLYFDMRNNRPGGGNVMSAGSGASGRNSTFSALNSDLSVWKNGANLNGNPTKTWSLFDYTLQGRYFDTIVSTNIPSEFNVQTYGTSGASEYSRMSANNATAVVDSLRVPTNADKYIYGHVSVPEGLADIRDAWTDEVYVTVNVYNADNSLAYAGLTGTTVGIASDNSNQGLSVYGEPEKGGILVIDVPNGAFLETGQWIKVMSAWRGSADSTSNRVHISTADDLKASDVTTRDVTPPTALTVDDLDASVRMYQGDLTTRATVISGTSQEVGATVYLYKNNILWATGSVGTDEQWSITLPGILTETDTIAVALNDDVANATDLTSYDLAELVDNGIFANNGNENSSGDYTFHDATFSTRLELGVIYYGVLELTVSPEISYGTNAISPGKTVYPAGTMELKVEDSRVFRNEWELTAELDEPFTLDGGSDVLNIDLVYAYGGVETVIDSNAVSIWQHTNTSDIFNLYDQWAISGSQNGLFVKASAGDVKVGSYTAKVNWVLSDVP